MATYGVTDRCTGGTASADIVNGGNAAANAFDNNESTYWERPAATALPGWIKYDFGAGVLWAISKLSVLLYSSGSCTWRAFTVNGSNNNSDWTELASLEAANTFLGYQTFTWTNRTKYRYIKIIITTDYRAGDNYCSTFEIQMFEGIYPAGGLGFGNPWMFLKDAWEKHDKLWAPKGLILPKDLSFQI